MENIDNTIKTAWIKQLNEDWKTANYNYFKNSMRPPHIELSYSERMLGKWKGGHYRQLSISIFLIYSYAWEYVQEVLYHEMAHQYVEEILEIRDDLPHGEAFKRICRENGIDSTATGNIHVWVEKRKNRFTVNSGNHTILDKVHKLLALAQSKNEHEAQIAMAKAHELLLKHNVSLLEADAGNHYIHKQIGGVGRRDTVKSIISAILCKYFFVEAIWTFGYDQHKNRNGRVLEIYGTPENIEMAEYVYNYLQNVSELLWAEYKKQKKIEGNKHRRTFIYGLLEGFYHKLEGQAVVHRSNKLVWKGDPRLKEFYLQRNPRRVQTSSRYSRSCQDAYTSGIHQGKNLVIRKGIYRKGNGEIKYLN
ncbi:MAG: DUF2786 domain-containing protein [Candidatus Kuenenia sp.]|nr:DUF2786 domain-containing protein [Candidatus Kuenenia hertensis]